MKKPIPFEGPAWSRDKGPSPSGALRCPASPAVTPDHDERPVSVRIERTDRTIEVRRATIVGGRA